MHYLFDKWTSLRPRLLRARYIFLCLDFDGTIVPIRPRPQDALLPEDLRLLLCELADVRHFFVGIISGRSLKDIQAKVGIKGLIYAGNHGLEISYRKRKFIYPQAKRYISLISEVARRLSKELAFFPQAILEKKDFSLSLHYRLLGRPQLSRLKKVFREISRPYLTSKRLRLTQGKKVWELRSPIAWDKGKAFLWLFKKLQRPAMLSIYIGDDLTDEDAFREINKKAGLSVLVGTRKSSSARYYLKGTQDTRRFLEQLKQLCQK